MHCCERAAVYFRLLLRLIKYFQSGHNNLVLSSWVCGEVMGSQLFRHQLFLSYKISDFTQRKICCLWNSSWNSRVIRKKGDPNKEVSRAFIRSAGDLCLISFLFPIYVFQASAAISTILVPSFTCFEAASACICVFCFQFFQQSLSVHSGHNTVSPMALTALENIQQQMQGQSTGPWDGLAAE